MISRKTALAVVILLIIPAYLFYTQSVPSRSSPLSDINSNVDTPLEIPENVEAPPASDDSGLIAPSEFAPKFTLERDYACRNCGCDSVLYNGNPSEKINFFFVSDGFTNEDEFKDYVRFFTGLQGNDPFSFLNYVPFSDFKSDYNIFTFFNPEIDWQCRASAETAAGGACDTPVSALDTLLQYCEAATEADFIIVLSKYEYRSSAYLYFPEELERLKLLKISLGSLDLTNLAEDPKNTGNCLKAMFLHELGHALGSLSDEYQEDAKGTYKPISPLSALNVDSVGCPRWCSGTVNTAAPCYFAIEYYNDCIAGLEDTAENDAKFKECYDKVMSAGIPVDTVPEGNDNCYTDGTGLYCRYFDCDTGIDCMPGTGCYWLAAGTNGYRSMAHTMMTGHIWGDMSRPVGLGPFNEMQAADSIRKKIANRRAEIDELNLEIINISQEGFPAWWAKTINAGEDGDSGAVLHPFLITLRLTTRAGEPIQIDNNYRNYVSYASDGVLNKDLSTGDIQLLYQYYKSPKDGDPRVLTANDHADITFLFRYNDVYIQERYRFNFFSMTIEGPFEPLTDYWPYAEKTGEAIYSVMKSANQ